MDIVRDHTAACFERQARRHPESTEEFLCDCPPRQSCAKHGSLAALHNRMSGEIVKRIIGETIDAGGEFSAIFVLLESIVVGVIYAQSRLTGDQIAVTALMEGVRQRLAELRLADAEPAGHA